MLSKINEAWKKPSVLNSRLTRTEGEKTMLRGFSRPGIQSKVLALTIFCLGAASAFAVHDDGHIEMDGDVVSSVFDDWEDVYNDCGTSGPCPPVTTGASRQSFQSDSGLPDPTAFTGSKDCLLYTSPSPRDVEESRMPSSA